MTDLLSILISLYTHCMDPIQIKILYSQLLQRDNELYNYLHLNPL